MKTIHLVLLDGKPHKAFETMEEAWEYSEANPLAAFGCMRVMLMEANWKANQKNSEGWAPPVLVKSA